MSVPGVSVWGGLCPGGGGEGISVQGVGGLCPGGSPSRDPIVNRMTDRCKNITVYSLNFICGR